MAKSLGQLAEEALAEIAEKYLEDSKKFFCVSDSIYRSIFSTIHQRKPKPKTWRVS